MRLRYLLLLGACVTLFQTAYSQTRNVVESASDHIILRYDFEGAYALNDTVIDGRNYTRVSGGYAFRAEGEPWLPAHFLNVGVPFGSMAKATLLSSEKLIQGSFHIMPYPGGSSFPAGGELKFDSGIYASNSFFPKETISLLPQSTFRYSRIQPVAISPYRWNPVTRQLEFTKSITFRIDYIQPSAPSFSVQPVTEDPLTVENINATLVNAREALQMMAKEVSRSNKPANAGYWYNPNLTWYKTYVQKKGVYRVSYEDLQRAGVPVANLQSSRLQVFNAGTQTPLDMVDGKDGRFNPGDYFQFVGYPPPASAYCRQNIYDSSNVYWLTAEGIPDSALRYRGVNGNLSQWDATQQYFTRTDFYEKDVIFEPLGLATDDHRDYWQWGVARGFAGSREVIFHVSFKAPVNLKADSPYVLLRINFHGMTNYNCDFAHKAKILINGREVGKAFWNGQTEFTYERKFMIHPDSIRIFPDGNYLDVECDGVICHQDQSDEIRVNWFELSYLSENRVGGSELQFTANSEHNGKLRFWLWQWASKKMKVYIPEQKKLIDSVLILNDADRTAIFVDSLVRPSTYFAVSDSVFFVPDSIVRDGNSDLRNTGNGADYIIISHRKFSAAAERLKALRQQNFPDTAFAAPRIRIVYADDIYDEFSYGVFEPLALQRFVKYAFENWAGRAPSYVVLIGDMSHDYRGLMPNSRPNFIPSIMYHSVSYGSAASDNAIVCIAGEDVIPDLAIGRLSIEKPEEGTILIDKLAGYPADNSKKWKENVLLLASGLSNSDEFLFMFNDASMSLNDDFLRPQGFNAKMLFRYPNKPEHMRYQGSTAEIRQAIDEGAALLNYYGHGGGYQWDLTFLNDDIYVLQNGGRLPLIISVTCYTAHFDNQDVFGEQFNKVPNKGSIGFFGSSGLTHWEVGKFVNNYIFDGFFKKRNFISGKVFLSAKTQTPGIGYYANQTAMLTYLGDPVFKLTMPEHPDFAITDNDIWLENQNPVVGDSVKVFARMFNYGITTQDSVNVELYFSAADTSGFIARKRIPVFGQHDTAAFYWVPSRGGLTALNVRINPSNEVVEPDYSDNRAGIQVPVFDISAPNIVSPVNGHIQKNQTVEFVIADFGNSQQKILDYTIEIDTSVSFLNPLIAAQNLRGADGILRWSSPALPKGMYFWRSRIREGSTIGKWSPVAAFEISDSTFGGFSVRGGQLKLFTGENMVYDAAAGAMLLNKDFLPPKPTRDKFISELKLDDTLVIKKTGLGSIATDGTYLYVGNMFYYISVYHGDSTGKSRIYKIGTGNNGTVAGHNYGEIPGFYHQIRDQFCYYRDGNLYVPTIDPRVLLRVNPANGITDTVRITAGLIEKQSGTVRKGGFYLSADSQYVYNLAFGDSTGANRYSLRIFDPSDNWKVVADYYYPFSLSYTHFCNFFVYDKYFYPYENFDGGLMRRYRISDGVYDAEWQPWFDENPATPIRFYAWAFDRGTNLVYGSVYRPGANQTPIISKFAGKYLEAKGSLRSPAIGPASKWDWLNLKIAGSTLPKNYLAVLEGLNSSSRRWDTLNAGTFTSIDLRTVSADYSNLRCSVLLTDSSYNSTEPLGVQSVQARYSTPPEIVLQSSDYTLAPDSLYQGDICVADLKVRNVGKSVSDTVTVQFKLDGQSSSIAPFTAVIPADSVARFVLNINTAKLPANTSHTLQTVALNKGIEYFTYNNIQSKSFFVIRDSLKPKLTVLFDGKEIGDGDIVSAKPRVEFRLKDNSPLPLDSSSISVFYNNRLLSYQNDSLTFSYTPAPSREAVVTWNPVLKKQNRHFVDIKAKDATGNFFTDDSGYYRLNFYVYEVNDVAYVYNYPNPFTDDSYFTFEIRGVNKPEKISVRIFTIAGRLIRTIEKDGSQFDFNRNKIYWDGRDADGNEIANGTYLYKLIVKFPDRTRTTTQKLVKMK